LKTTTITWRLISSQYLNVRLKGNNMSEAIGAPSAPAPVVTPDTVNTDVVDSNVDVEASAEGAEATPIEEKVKEPTKAEQKKSNKKKFDLKVDGQIESLEIDLDNEEELRKHLQLSKAAYKRMQESSEMRKGVQELLDTLRADPLKVLTDPRLQIPEDVRKKLAEAIINDEISEMAKTPEQKEKERIQKEYERLKKEVEDERKAREVAEQARLQEQMAMHYDQEISGAIEASGMPKNARTVRYFAEALQFCLQNNLDMTAKDLIPYVKKQALSEFREVISALPDEDFESWLGKDQISRIRKRNIQRAKEVASAQSIPETGTAAPKEEKPQEKILMKDFFKKLGR